MKITQLADRVHVTRSYEISGAPAIPKAAWAPTRLMPDLVVVEFVDGKYASVKVFGGRVLKGGKVSAAIRDESKLWSFEREDWPEWIEPLLKFDATNGGES